MQREMSQGGNIIQNHPYAARQPSHFTERKCNVQLNAPKNKQKNIENSTV